MDPVNYDFYEALKLMEQVDIGKDASMKQLKKNIEAKIQQKQGLYDFYEVHMQSLSLKEGEKLDILEYFGPIEINMTSDGRGRGLFASRDIMKGEFILVEKAFVDSENSGLDQAMSLSYARLFKDPNDNLVEITVNLIKKMRSNKLNSIKALKLMHGPNTDKEMIKNVHELTSYYSYPLDGQEDEKSNPFTFEPIDALKIAKYNMYGSQNI